MVEKTCWIVIRICLCYFLFCINIGNFIPSFLSASTEFIRQASLFHPIFKRRFCKTAGLCPFEKPTPEKRNLFFFPLPVSHLDVFIFPRDAAPRRQNKVFFSTLAPRRQKKISTLAGSWKTKTKTKGHRTSEAKQVFFNSCRILCLRHPYPILGLMRLNTWEIESFPPQIQVYLAVRKIWKVCSIEQVNQFWKPHQNLSVKETYGPVCLIWTSCLFVCCWAADL